MTRSGRVRAVQVERRKGYESISRDSLQDRRLSFKARGIMAYLKSMPTDWETSTEDIAGASDKDGYEAVNNGIKELEAAGLFARLKRQGPGGRWEWLWIYSDDPEAVAEAVESWNAQHGGRMSPRGGNTSAKGRPDQQRKAADAVSGKTGHGPAPVSGKSVHGKPVHGSAVHGQPRNKEINSQIEPPQPPAGRGEPEIRGENPARREVCEPHGRRNCRQCGLSPRVRARAEREAVAAERAGRERRGHLCPMCVADGVKNNGETRWIRVLPGTQVPVTPYDPCDHETPHTERVRQLVEEDNARVAERGPSRSARTFSSDAARAAARAQLAYLRDQPPDRHGHPRRHTRGRRRSGARAATQTTAASSAQPPVTTAAAVARPTAADPQPGTYDLDRGA